MAWIPHVLEFVLPQRFHRQLRSASNMLEDWQQLQQSLQQKQLDYQNRSVVTEHELKSLHTKVWQMEKEQRVRARYADVC